MTKWISKHDVEEVGFDRPSQFIANLKKHGTISKTIQELRPRKDVGCGTEAIIYVTYVDLEDAIDVYLGLTKDNSNSYKQHMKYLDILFMIKGRLDERAKFEEALAM